MHGSKLHIDKKQDFTLIPSIPESLNVTFERKFDTGDSDDVAISVRVQYFSTAFESIRQNAMDDSAYRGLTQF